MSEHDEHELRLAPFESQWAETVLSWNTTAEQLRWWTAREDFPITDPAIFTSWHADPDIAPYVLLTENEPLAFGEIWFDRSDNTAELARLLVSPAHRRKGYAQVLIDRLSTIAVEAECDDVFVRVFPDNVPAICCYEAAGFARVSSPQERSWNHGQRFDFVWMVLLRDS